MWLLSSKRFGGLRGRRITVNFRFGKGNKWNPLRESRLRGFSFVGVVCVFLDIVFSVRI